MKRYLQPYKHHFRLFALVSILFLSACSRTVYPEPTFGNVTTASEKKQLKTFMEAGVEKTIDVHKTNAAKIIKTARKFLGVPHCMGGTTSKCMDCSGLLVTAFAENGISIPRSSEEQARYGILIAEMDQLKKGDMVFFIRSYNTPRFITHSGIYLGDNQFIHASSSRGVTITSLNNSWWKERFVFGTRVFE